MRTTTKLLADEVEVGQLVREGEHDSYMQVEKITPSRSGKRITFEFTIGGELTVWADDLVQVQGKA